MVGPWPPVAGAVAIDEHLSGANHAFWRREVAVDTFFDPDGCSNTRVPRRLRSSPACTFDEVELS